ncbi:hypothetical protein BDZ85DRAFT_254138 [Elsinoe ampelina]|uniref:Uncharacterized protein n=1 Tax=Elsinoe ampelina TaxID=302913 RepID=A0A6A6GNN8_9PEZI|nr:hypothetical protein BDZ85DRAFT_254138 [Elsinoe ampelina]
MQHLTRGVIPTRLLLSDNQLEKSRSSYCPWRRCQPGERTTRHNMNTRESSRNCAAVSC